MKELSKRLLSVLLLLCMLIGLVPATGLFTTKVSAAESWDVDEDGTLSILCIGNSFSRDAMEYVYQIASNLGITSIYLGNVYYGGCSLAQHWSYANSDSASYTYYYNSNGTWKSSSSYKMSTALTSRSWDYVTMQQASPSSGNASTYNSDLTNLISYVKGKLAAKSPNAKLAWHMTWAYQSGSTKLANSIYSSQSVMYNNIISAVQSKIVTNSNFSFVIPSGTAIQNARTSLIKDNLTRDGYHLNYNIGRYIAGLTFVKAITGLDISNVSFRATNVPDGYRAIAIESANNAVTTPYSVTTSAYTNPAASPASDYYTTRKITWKALSYWNSANASYNKQFTDKSNSSQYYSTQRFNSYTLPVGSVITLTSGSGWQYRPEAWLTDEQQTSRPGTTTASYTVCSDEWWKNADGKYYLYRAFNLSKTGTPALANNLASTLDGLFKIYVPKEYVTTDMEPEALYTQIANLADPIPNNSRVYWGSEANITAMSGKKYIFVYGPSSGGSSPPSNTYAWDPTTPRLFGTFHAASVQVSSKSGTQRVYNADTSWQITLELDAEFDYTQAEYSAQPDNQYMAAWKVKLPVNNLDTDSNKGLYLSNNVSYSSSNGYANGLGATWRLRDSDWYGALPAHTNSSGTTKTTTTWSKRNARAHLYFNWNTDRMHFFFWPQFRTTPANIGDKTRRTSVRSIFTNPGTDDPFFSMGTTELGNSDAYACFYLFQVDTSKANTEKLYAKLKEVQKYILVDHTYFEAEYATFLTALNKAYSTYGSANGNASTQSTVDSALNALAAAAENLNAYNQIEYMSIPYNKKIDGDALVGTAGALEGTYFIDRLYNGNIDAVHSFMDTSLYKDTNANGAADAYGIIRMNVGSNGVIADDLTHAVTLRAVTGTTNGYTMQLENRDFLVANGSSWRLMPLGNPQTWYFTDASYTSIADLVSIYDYNKEYMLYCDAGDEYYWRLYDKDSSVVTDKPERFGFRLFQLSPTTLELYRALQFIQPYCDQNEAIKRYPQDLYKQFLADINSAKSAYTTYNNNTYFSNASAKATCEAWADKLRAWADTLAQADSTLSYIDIPVEVFDFKADGVMFEYDSGSTYGLQSSGSVSTALPGTLWYYNNGALSTANNGGTSFRRGLTETKLVDGHLVYKLQTIENVAQNILADDATRGSSTQYLDSDNAAYNKEFFDKIGKITELGTWELTRAKIEGNYNGGDLDWNEVTTAFDMAYYVLTYLWREVPQTDANKLSLSDGDTYNMKVPEREVLRLYKEASSGLYTFYSEDNMAYNGYYMYNTVPTIDNPPINNYADFTPVNGIGFEAGGVETDASRYYAKHGWVDKYETDNYHYVVHAYGSFVYYEDQDLYFQFVGDDDVYFYINNELAMDLGSAHSAVGDTLKLKNFTMSDGTKLVDGEVYTFDMYYAERHTHASNMKFNTNIKIVDTDTLTTKGQYVEISGDNDMVDSATGMGGELVDNGLVRVGDTVTYSFDVVNSHDVAVYDLIFEDETLGTYLSPNIIALSNEEKTFTPTVITDIEVYYRTSSKDDNDNITINSDTPIIKTVAEIKEMINTANTATATTPGTSLPTGSYRVTMTSEQDLMELLALGIPANCQISIYGFKRYMTEDDENKTITNDLAMTCSYLPWGSNDTETSVRTLTGTASRILKVAALSGIPNATKQVCVIDYGKPLTIDADGIISAADGVTNDGLVGFTTSGYNGAFLKSKPTDLIQVVDTGNGLFNYRLGTIYYTLKEMLSGIDKVYAVYSISGCAITDTQGKARDYPYILAEINIVPATTVYYETDFDKIEYVGSDSTYSLVDFDSDDTTVWGTTKPNNMTGTKVDGVLRGTVTGADPYILMDYTTGSALSHVVTADDVVKVRVKSDSCIGDGLQVFFMTNDNENPTGGISTDIAAYTPNGEWQVITLPIYSAVVGKTVKGIRLDPIGNNTSFVSEGSYEFDWVYIGPDIPDNELFANTSAEDSMFETVTHVEDMAFIEFTDSKTSYNAFNGAVNPDTGNFCGHFIEEPSAGSEAKRAYAEILVNHSDLSSYVLCEGDILKLRMMVSENEVFETDTLQATVSAINDGEGSFGETTMSVSGDGKYYIYAISVPAELAGQTLSNIFIQLNAAIVEPEDTDNSDESTEPAPTAESVTFEIDWFYVGPDKPLTISHSGVIYPDYWSDWTTEGTSEVSLQTTDKVSEADTYGYDAAYANDSTYSNNSSLYVVGAGVPNFIYKKDASGNFVLDQEGKKISVIDYDSVLAYSQTSFTFTGTGFDIISRTGPEQGALRVAVCDTEGNIVKTASVINKGNSELYQIPVVSVEKLDYGTYTVHIFVNASYTNTDYPALNRGGEFYFDAVRIYNPVDTTATDIDSAYVYSLYQAHGEADPTYTEIRNLLIGADDVGSFNAGGSLAGVVYLDAKDANGNDYNITIENYTDVGPNNEVYLQKNNAIAFKLVVSGAVPASIDIAAKCVGATAATLCSSVSTTAPTTAPTTNATNIASCTAQYYPLTVTDWATDSKGNSYVYIAVQNTGSGILSLCDIKLGYSAPVSTGEMKSAAFVIDSAMMRAFGVEEAPAESTLDENLTPNLSIAVGAEMQVVYTVVADKVSAYESFYLEVVKEVADGESITTVYSPDNGNMEVLTKDGSVTGYRVTYTGINAKEMGDEFTATLYAVASDGTIYYSNANTNSIKSFLMGKITDTVSPATLKTLAVDMLNYGAAAQLNFSYDTENLVNADLTDEQKALGTQTQVGS